VSRQAKTVADIEPLDGLVFDEHYRRGVSATLPPGVAASEEFWADLESAVDVFLRWEIRRLRRPPTKERERWQRIETLASELGKELLRAHRETPRTHSEADWAKLLLVELAKLRTRARNHIRAYTAIAKGYSRRRNDSRAFLYASVLELWTKHLRGELKYRRTPKGVLYGPLIDFFRACVDPFLSDEAPTVRAISDIIDRARRPQPRAKAYGFDPPKIISKWN
jgi:hypothetical protein